MGDAGMVPTALSLMGTTTCASPPRSPHAAPCSTHAPIPMHLRRLIPCKSREEALGRRLINSRLPSLQAYIDIILNDPSLKNFQFDALALAERRRSEEAEQIVLEQIVLEQIV